MQTRGAPAMIAALLEAAHEHVISLNTVFLQVQAYAQAKGLKPLPLEGRQIHAVRNSVRDGLVSQALFAPVPPDATELIKATSNVFRSDFYVAMRQLLNERGTGAGYLQQVLDIGLQDATAMRASLVGDPAR